MESSTRWKIRILVWLVLTGAVVAALIHLVGVSDSMPYRFTYEGKQWELAEPAWLWLAALAPLFYLIQGFSLSDMSRLQQAISLLLRTVIILLLALALTRPRTVTEHRRVCTVFIVDASDSVSPAQLEEARKYIQQVHKRRGINLVKIITFAQRPHMVDIPEKAEQFPKLKRHGSGQGAASDLQAAIQLAYGLYPAGYIRRMVIFSDGIQTKGDLMTEVFKIAADKKESRIRIHHRVFAERPRDEVLIRDIALPKKVDVGKPFVLQANVYSSHNTTATFTLKYGVAPNEMYWNERERVKKVTLKPGLNPINFEAQVHERGLYAFVMNMQLPQESRGDGTKHTRDHIKENNRAVAIMTVKDKPKVLLLEGGRGGAARVAPWVSLMAQEDIKVEVRPAYGLPSRVWGLKKYACVIFSDVGANFVGMGKMAALDSYVRNHGGCFIMVGGDNSFGSGGYYRTRIERMLPVRMDTEKSRNQPSVAMVLVIDRSGSMSGQNIEMAKEAAKASAMMLSSSDQIGIIAHDSGAIPIIPLTRASNRLRIQNAIATITADGGTDIYPAYEMAASWLRASNARIKHVIVLSDGQSPNRERIWALAEEMRSSRITTTAVGIGSGVDRALLQTMARNGGGRYYLTDNPSNIPKIFTKETSIASRSGIVDAAIKAVQVRTAAFLRGVNIKAAPLLRGYNPTKAKYGADVFFITNPYGEPLLARWRLGLGKTAAFTSDIKGRWANAWFNRWTHGLKQLWAQLLRDTMRSRTYQQFPMYTTVESGRIKVVVDAVDKHDTFQNDLDSVVTVFDWWAPSRKRRVKLKQTAAGRYEGTFTMHRYGAYVLEADHRKVVKLKPRKPGGKPRIYRETIAKSFGSVTLSYPREYLQLQPSRKECTADPSVCPGLQLLARASKLTDGVALGSAITSVNTIFNPGRAKELRYEERWHYLLYLLLGLLLLDVLLRRIRLFGYRPLRAA